MDRNKSSIYENIYNSKFFLKALKRENWEIRLPKSSCDKIISLYGKEMILPLSFISFCNPVESKDTVINMSSSIKMHSSLQITNILRSLNNLFIYPSSYEGMDEMEKMRRSPKINNKCLKNISKKIGLDFSDMINYLSIQIVTVNMKESIKTIKSLELYIRIFNNIHSLVVKFPNQEKFPITYYSYKILLNMSGFNISQMFPLFKIHQLNNITREELLNNEKDILYDKVLVREIKEGIDEKIKEEKVDIYEGTDQCKRIPKSKHDDLEMFREEESNLLLKLSKIPKEEIIENKKDNNNNENGDKEEIIKIEEEPNKINEEKNLEKDIISITKKEEDIKKNDVEKEEVINIKIDDINIVNEPQNVDKKEGNEEIIEGAKVNNNQNVNKKEAETVKENEIEVIKIEEISNSNDNNTIHHQEKNNSEIKLKNEPIKNKFIENIKKENNEDKQQQIKEEQTIIIKQEEGNKNIDNNISIIKNYKDNEKYIKTIKNNEEIRKQNQDLNITRSKYNSLEKRKFKIRRAVFVKVEKDK